MTQKIRPETQELINDYLHLKIGVGCSCPYFNNRRTKIRAGLRALIGKGTPKDIIYEAEIIALRRKIKINDYSSEDLKKFLVDNGLGVDCSGYAYHIFDTEYRTQYHRKLASKLHIKGNFFRHLSKWLRPAENIGVGSLSHERNSVEVNKDNLQAGDFISVLGAGENNLYNHIFIITEIVKTNEKIEIHYTHSYTRPEEGRYGHGVRIGFITLNNNESNIRKTEWHENSIVMIGEELFPMLKQARNVSFRRLKAFKQ